jgi:hypothetical protein
MVHLNYDSFVSWWQWRVMTWWRRRPLAAFSAQNGLRHYTLNFIFSRALPAENTSCATAVPHSVRNVVPHIGLFPVRVFDAFPPPRSLNAQFLCFQHKTFSLHDVEEKFTNQIGWTCIRHLQARSKSAHRNTWNYTFKNVTLKLTVLLSSAVFFWYSRKEAGESSNFTQAVVYSGDALFKLGRDTEAYVVFLANPGIFRDNTWNCATVTVHCQFCHTGNSKMRRTVVAVSVFVVQLLSGCGKLKLVGKGRNKRRSRVWG